MKFRHLPVNSDQDTTANFEQLQPSLTGIEGSLTGLNTTVPAGAWAKPESLSAKLTESSIEVRKESGRASARLRGTAKTAAEVKAGETLCTLKAEHRPVQAEEAVMMEISAGTFITAIIAASGVVTARAAIATTQFISFGGVTYSLT